MSYWVSLSLNIPMYKMGTTRLGRAVVQVDGHSLKVPGTPISCGQTLISNGSEQNVQQPLGRKGHPVIP